MPGFAAGRRLVDGLPEPLGETAVLLRRQKGKPFDVEPVVAVVERIGPPRRGDEFIRQTFRDAFPSGVAREFPVSADGERQGERREVVQRGAAVGRSFVECAVAVVTLFEEEQATFF